MSLHAAPSTFVVPYRPPSELELQHAAHLERRRRERELPAFPDPEAVGKRQHPIWETVVPPDAAKQLPFPRRTASMPAATVSISDEMQAAQALLEEEGIVPPRGPGGRVKYIQSRVCAKFGVTRLDMVSFRRTAKVVEPRQLAMYLARRLTLMSLPEIGRRFGGRDHTTILHAVRKYEEIVADGGPQAEEIGALERSIRTALGMEGDDA